MEIDKRWDRPVDAIAEICGGIILALLVFVVAAGCCATLDLGLELLRVRELMLLETTLALSTSTSTSMMWIDSVRMNDVDF